MTGASAYIYVQYRVLLIKHGPTKLDVMQCFFFTVILQSQVRYHLIASLHTE